MGIAHTRRNSDITKVILLSRVHSTGRGRRIVNLDDIINYLHNLPGVILKVFDGVYSLQECLDIFSDADVVIGLHGGALYNMLFSPPGVTVIEIVPTKLDGTVVPEHLAHQAIWHLAQSLGHSYWRIGQLPVSHDGDVNIGVTKLKAIFRRLTGH